MTAAPPANIIELLGDTVKSAGPGKWMARCPAHDDRHASLSITVGQDGRWLLYCQAKCETRDVCRALGIELRDLFPPRENSNGNPHHAGGNGAPRRIIATYDYTDREGTVLYQAVRYEPKNFKQRRPDNNGGWIWNLDSVQRVLYRYPDVLDGDSDSWVFVPEGEKDVDNLYAAGLVATTNVGGAGKWQDGYSEFLRGRRVCLLPHNDDAGRKHVQTVAKSMHGIAAEVRVLELPDLPAKGDVSDWLNAGGTANKLVAMADAAPAVSPQAVSGPLMMCMADVEARAVDWLWPGRIPLGRITLLVGRPGEGKSFLTTDMAARVTTGTPWPDGSDCASGSVILISAEDDPADTIRPRLDAHHADCRRVHLLSGVRRVGEDGKAHDVMFTLADVAALEDALRRVPDCRLIVVDPIGSFLGGGTDAHRDNEVRGVLAPVARLAEQYGPAVLVVAHRRKSAGSIADDLALGSRAFTGIARAVWHLSRDGAQKSRRLLLPGKNNLAADGDGLAFAIVGETPAIAWEREPVRMSADDALAVENGDDGEKPGPEPEARNAAADWLVGLLADGEVEVAKARTNAQDAGLAWRTVQRAADALGVIREKNAFSGGWQWRFPKPAIEDAKSRAKSPKSEQPGILASSVNQPENAYFRATPDEDAKLIYLGTHGGNGHVGDGRERGGT